MRKKILIIDDDKIYCSILKKILKEDYDLFFTENSQKALEILKDINRPDLVITDLNLPDVKGVDFITLLMSSVNGQKTPVIVISGMDDEKMKMDIINLGVVHYFVKPIERIYLKEEIDRLM